MLLSAQQRIPSSVVDPALGIRGKDVHISYPAV